jgi:hypothetical protein
MRQGRAKYDPTKNAQISPGHAEMTETFFAVNKVNRGPDWQQVNNDRADFRNYADRQGGQDRDAMNLYHYPSS